MTDQEALKAAIERSSGLEYLSALDAYSSGWHAALAWLRSQQEPVAWMYPRAYGSGLSFVKPVTCCDEDGNVIDPVPLYALTDEQIGDLMAVERMRHDFGPLAEFYTKHALGPMLPPSCLVCGQQTLPAELEMVTSVAIKHAELPGIVVCKQCRDAALNTRHNA